MSILYVADRDTDTFQQERTAVDVVCAGDSITGWNNYGPVGYWPYPTYPQLFQELCEPLHLKVADGGIAGEISRNGIGHVRDYLDLFPTARYFVIGFGTNDLGMWPDLERTSEQIIKNLGQMVTLVRNREKFPILLNVPNVNGAMFSPDITRESRSQRDFHNARLLDYCNKHDIPLADICSHLRDAHFADEVHPNAAGADIIAREVDRVFQVVHARIEQG